MSSELRERLRKELPTLHLCTESSRTLIRGRLPVVAPDGTELDSYQIEVEFAKNHPKAPPTVREIGGRIPHSADRHNPNGRACLFVPDQQWEFWNETTSIIDFIKTGPVHQYFFSQTYFVEAGSWPFGERPHGFAGVIDYYLDLLETKSIGVVVAFLELLAADNLGAGELCYCGKINWLNSCHIKRLLHIRSKISRQRARYTLEKMLAGTWAIGWTRSDILLIKTASSFPLAASLKLPLSVRPVRRRARRPRHFR